MPLGGYMLGAAAIGAAGSIGGSLIGASSAKKAGEYQTRAANAAAAQNVLAGQNAANEIAWLKDYGQSALPYLQYMATGQAPTWDSAQDRELASLLAQQSALEAQKVDLEGKLSVAGTSHDTRHYAEAFSPQLGQVQQQLDRLVELQAAQKAYSAYQDTDFARWSDDGSGYLDQIVNMDITPDLQAVQSDPIYQWKQQQNQEQMDRFFASRGRYDTRDSANALLDSNMQLAGTEADKVYSRQFNQLAQGINGQNQLYNQRYGYLQDAVGLGAGASNSLAGIAQNTGQQGAQLALMQGDSQANTALQQGAIQGNMLAQLGGMGADLMGTYGMMKAQAPALPDPTTSRMWSQPTSNYSLMAPKTAGVNALSGNYSLMG